MSIAQIKFLSWLAAGVLTAGLAYYVFDFIKAYRGMPRQASPELVTRALQSVEVVQAKADELVNYEDVRRLVLPSCDKCKDGHCKHLNWTGKQVVVQATVDTTATPPPQVYTPVKDLLRIQSVIVDASNEKGSAIWVKYKPTAQVTLKSPTGNFLLRTGDTLHAPHDYATVHSISAEGVVFAFKDGKRANETLAAIEFDPKTRIVEVGPNGVMMPKLGGVPKAELPAWNPERTTATGNGRFRLGTEDAKEFENSWDTILSRDVRHERHKDPRTGKYDGIEIKSVTSGSIVERHGAQAGDVIRSINGNPVTSVSEAIQFVKNHKDEYTSWEVIVENRGRQRTMVFQSPQH